jgi:hypothetical protein
MAAGSLRFADILCGTTKITLWLLSLNRKFGSSSVINDEFPVVTATLFSARQWRRQLMRAAVGHPVDSNAWRGQGDKSAVSLKSKKDICALAQRCACIDKVKLTKGLSAELQGRQSGAWHGRHDKQDCQLDWSPLGVKTYRQ